MRGDNNMLAKAVTLLKGITNQVSQVKKQEVTNFLDMGQGLAIKPDMVEGLKLVCTRPLSMEEVITWTEPFVYNQVYGKDHSDEISGRDYKLYNFFTVMNGSFQLLSFEICDSMSESEMLSILEQQNSSYVQEKPLTFISSIAGDFMPQSTSKYVVTFEQVPYHEAKRIIANAKRKPKRTINSDTKTTYFVPNFIMLGGVLFRTKYVSALWKLADCLKYVLFQFGPTHFCLINDQPAVLGLNAIVHQDNITVTVDESGMAEITIRVESDEEFELYPSEIRLIKEICSQLGVPLPRIKERSDEFFITSGSEKNC
jgi:hypothetical protein